MIRQLRTTVSLPLVGAFYALIWITGFIAWLANLIAGDDGVIVYVPTNSATGDETFRVGGDSSD